MSKSFTTPNGDIDTSAANIVAYEGESHAADRYQTVLQLLNNTPKFTAEWLRLKEEEVQLRRHPDTKESNCAGLVVDSSAGDVGDMNDGEANVKEISTLECNPRAMNKNTGRSSRGQFPSDSINNPQEAKIGADDPKNENLTVIKGDLPGTLFAGSSLNKSDSPSASDGKERLKVTRRITPPTTHVLHHCDIEDEVEQHYTNVSIGIEEAIDTLPTTVDEVSPVPFSLKNYGSPDVRNAKASAAINILHDMNDEGPSPPLSIRFADSAITEKWSRVDTTSAVKSYQRPISEVQTPPTPKSIHTNQGPVSKEDVDPKSRSMRPEVVINYELLTSSPVSQTDYIHPRANANDFSQSVPNESLHGVEDKEDVFVLPEAFRVEANAPVEVPNVGVAELVEPDRSTLPLKKRHAYVVSILFAAVLIALGVTIYFTRDKSPSIERGEATIILSPSLQPTFLLTSSQPSFSQPPSPQSLSIKYAIEKNVLQRNLTFDVMEDTNARVLALSWITNNDDLKLVALDEKLFQRYILVLLAFEYSNLGWLSNVNSNGTVCVWLGVVCDEDEHVVKLKLDENTLDGTLPPEIGSLQYLQMLSMSGNSLSGTLPYELGNLSNMSELLLNANNFTGSLPSEIGKLKNLTALNLSGNEFTGTLPLELGTLNKLTKVSLGSNQFNGTLPFELLNLIELSALDLHGNQFSGTLPRDLGNLNKLAELYLNSNQLDGTLPSELGNLSNLTKLDLSVNELMGPLPSELGNLNMLTTLDIVNNQLTGTLPSELGNMNKLTLLRLYYNQLTGTLPSELGNLREMTSLEISENRFNGTLPTEMGNLKELQTILVNENQLTGTIPSELGQLNKLYVLWLFSNKFVGTLPSELGHLTQLGYFWIYYNQFTGTLPSWIGDFTELSSLYVGGNRFEGTLPSELGLLKGLIDFGVDKNEFTGTLPSWIGDFRGLSVLWINNNQFTGTFPSEIENNLDLRDFCARSNNFTGPVPPDIQTNYKCYE